MICPRCGNTKFGSEHTTNLGGVIQRDRTCEGGKTTTGCGLVMRTHEVIVDVRVYNYKRNRSEWVELDEYKKQHREPEQEGFSGFNPRLFG